MEEYTNRCNLLNTFLDLNLSWDTKFEISKIIGNFENKEQICGEVYEVIKDCQNQEEVIEAIKKQYGVTINPDEDEEETATL